MKSSRFAYHTARSGQEAVELLSRFGDDAKPLAGGQSLVPILALRLSWFGHLVDLNPATDLVGVQRVDGRVRVGAMTRQRDAGEDPEVRTSVPLLAKAVPLIGHLQIRNRGTVGGSLAHADPAAELPAVAVALDADVDVLGPAGRRHVPASDFFLSTWTTQLDTTEILAAVDFPVWGPRSGFAVEEVARRHGDFALVGVACGLRVGSEGIDRAAVALFGVGSTPVRSRTAEQLLLGRGLDGPWDDVGEAASAELDPSDDVHATGRYRTAVASVVVERALEQAMEEASRG